MMVNSINLSMMKDQAKRLNLQNKKLRDNLSELFPNVPIFMNILTEEEIPDETMTYLVIETGNFTKIIEKGNSVTETVAVTFWSMNREDPVLDELQVILAGNDAGLRFTSASNDYIVNSDNSQIVNMFVARFNRGAKVGC